MQTNLPQPVFEEKEEEKITAPTPNQVSTGQRSLDTNFATDLLHHVSDFVADEKEADEDIVMFRRLDGMNHRLNRLFKPAVQNRVNELCHHIVCGNPDQVSAILEKSIFLLEGTGTAINDAGYTITAMPYRAALCSEDPQMVAIVQKYLIDFAGSAEADDQWNAQFPAGWEKAEKVRWQPLFNQLKILDRAIRNADKNDITSSPYYELTVREDSEVARELVRFKSLLEATRDAPIKTGRAFNPHFMQAVAYLYDTYDNCYSYNNPKRLFCWQRVFGRTQRFVPAADAASFIDGLVTNTNKLKSNQPQSRSMKLRVWDHSVHSWVDSSYYPLDDSRLGDDYAIIGCGGVGLSGGGYRWALRSACGLALESFYHSKTVTLQKYIPSSTQQSRSLNDRCALM